VQGPFLALLVRQMNAPEGVEMERIFHTEYPDFRDTTPAPDWNLRPMTSLPPKDPGRLQEAISEHYSELSKRLQQIARFALEHPNDMALETIAVIAERAGVQPSAMIRFAKAFGYSGFSDMQRVFRARLVERAPSYSERLRLFRNQHPDRRQRTPYTVLREFASASILALEHLQEQAQEQELEPRLEQAAELLAGAQQIHLVGQRRSFPVVSYLAYALSHVDRYAHLLDGVGGMLFEQASGINKADVLVAVSFSPYAAETAEVVARAVQRGAAVIVITDSLVSPIASQATVCFEIKDAEVYAFRSLTASLCLAQALAMGMGLRLEGALEPSADSAG